MQNFLPTSRATPVVKGRLRLPAGEGKVTFLDARDVGAVAVQALVSAGHEGKVYEMSGGEALSHGDVASQLSDATGRCIVYEDIAPEVYAREKTAQAWSPAMVETMLHLFDLIRSGEQATLFDSVRHVTGRPPISFRRFAEDYAGVFHTRSR